MTDRRHTPESVLGTTILLVCGTGLTTISHVWGIGTSRASQMAACVGPVAIVLGIGMAMNGSAMPINRITLKTRIWGIVGSAVSVLHLWMAGYFDSTLGGRQVGRFAIPIALLVAWLLPARAYGDDAPSSPTPKTDMVSGRPQPRVD